MTHTDALHWFGVHSGDVDCPHWIPYLTADDLGMTTPKLTMDFRTGRAFWSYPSEPDRDARPESARADNVASRCTDELWHLGFSEAEAMGCGYPGEPAGVYARLICDGVAVPTSEAAMQLIAQCVAACDACYDHCTVRPPRPPAQELTSRDD